MKTLHKEDVEVESLAISDDDEGISAVIVFKTSFNTVEKFGVDATNLYCTYYPHEDYEDSIWCEAVYSSEEWWDETEDYFPTDDEENMLMQLIVDAVRKETGSCEEDKIMMREYLAFLMGESDETTECLTPAQAKEEK